VLTTTITTVHEVCSANRQRDTSADTDLNSRKVLREFFCIT